MKLQDILNNMHHDLLEDMIDKLHKENQLPNTYINIGGKEIEININRTNEVEWIIYDEDGNDVSDKYPNFKNLVDDNCPTWEEAREEYYDRDNY